MSLIEQYLLEFYMMILKNKVRKMFDGPEEKNEIKMTFNHFFRIKNKHKSPFQMTLNPKDNVKNVKSGEFC